MMATLTPADAVTLDVAASALRHAPASLQAAHLAPALDDLARRIREAAPTEPGAPTAGAQEPPAMAGRE